MGYTLSIGEAEISWTEIGVDVSAKLVKHDEAPAFGEPPDGENQRWPGYCVWSEFCRDLGILDVMMNTRNGGSGECQVGERWLRPLIAEHPGHTPITPEHLEYIEIKLEAYRKLYPDHRAEFRPVKEGCEDKGLFTPNEDLVDDPRYDGTLVRAEWLVYWMRWALENCERPVFVNT